MRNLPRRTLALLLLSVLALNISCGGSAAGVGDDTTAADVTETTAEVTEAVINWESANLPRKDFGGKDFVFLSANVDNMAYAWKLIDPEELTGEALSDAMFNRNKKIEEIYNVNIKTAYSGSVTNDVKTSINAGEDAYQTVFAAISGTFALTQEGFFRNWYSLPHVNVNAQWWDAAVVRDLSYHGKLYTLTGDISPFTNTRVYSLVFNKDLCRELGLELPYQAVENGRWISSISTFRTSTAT